MPVLNRLLHRRCQLPSPRTSCSCLENTVVLRICISEGMTSRMLHLSRSKGREANCLTCTLRLYSSTFPWIWYLSRDITLSNSNFPISWNLSTPKSTPPKVNLWPGIFPSPSHRYLWVPHHALLPLAVLQRVFPTEVGSQRAMFCDVLLPLFGRHVSVDSVQIATNRRLQLQNHRRETAHSDNAKIRCARWW